MVNYNNENFNYDEDYNEHKKNTGGLSLVLIIVAAVVFFSALIINMTMDKNTNTPIEPNNLNEGLDEPNEMYIPQNPVLPENNTLEPNVVVPPIDNDGSDSAQPNEKDVKEDNIVKNDNDTETSLQAEVYSSPLSSLTISMPFSYNKEAVYSKTFDEYRSDHTGCDYIAQKGESVFSIAKGKVEKVYEDNKYGVSVIINHGDGISSMYSNLDKNIFVKLNQFVAAGETIGSVGETAVYESADESHLHFSIMQNGEYTDPHEFLTK